MVWRCAAGVPLARCHGSAAIRRTSSAAWGRWVVCCRTSIAHCPRSCGSLQQDFHSPLHPDNAV